MSAHAVMAVVGLALVVPPSGAVTVLVPEEYASINLALDASASGDTVLVAPGVYDEADVRGPFTTVAYLKAGVTLKSVGGSGQTMIRIDGLGSGTEAAIVGWDSTGEETVVEGFEISGTMPGATGIFAASFGTLVVRDCLIRDLQTGRFVGAGMFAENMHVILESCEFVRCVATLEGGGLESDECTATLRSCVFRDCGPGAVVLSLGQGEVSLIEDCWFEGNAGRAVLIQSTATNVRRCVFLENDVGSDGSALGVGASLTYFVEVSDCLFAGNEAAVAGAVLWGATRGEIRGNTFVGNSGTACSAVRLQGQQLTFSNNVFADNSGGPAILLVQPQPDGGCNLFWNNSGGNAAGYEIQPTSILADPKFCDPDAGDYAVDSTSPCLPENNAGCGLIGALGQGCGTVSVEPQSWAGIKSLFRSEESR